MVLDSHSHWLAKFRQQADALAQPVWTLASFPSQLGQQLRDRWQGHSAMVLENQHLRKQLLVANARLTALQTLVTDNQQLVKLLKATQWQGLDVQLASILDVDHDPTRHRLILNVGARAGVTVGQTVVDDAGLMGQVIEVTAFQAIVLLITDPDHAVPVNIAPNGSRLIAYGCGDLLELRDIPLSVGIKRGDRIVTSGLGGRFPAGFLVGTVADLRPDETHAFLVGTVQPAAHLDRGRDVLLLRAPAQPPPMDLQRATSASGTERFRQSRQSRWGGV